MFEYADLGGDEGFKNVDHTVTAALRFPNGRMASFAVSQAPAGVSSYYQLVGSQGDLRVEGAYDYVGERKHFLRVDEKTKKTFRARDQFAPEAGVLRPVHPGRGRAGAFGVRGDVGHAGARRP